jgi:hypothetical protein
LAVIGLRSPLFLNILSLRVAVAVALVLLPQMVVAAAQEVF